MTAGIATLAGAPPFVAVRLGVAMLLLQVSIGALNDAVDVSIDAHEKPGKPIPRGLVSRSTALGLAVGGGAAGLAVSAASGPATALVGVAVLGLGYLYDLRLSRTPASWLPLALALPVLPIYAWVGATGSMPIGLVALLPIAFAAGAGLAIANGLADVERDAGVGRRTIAVALGPRLGWIVQSALLGGAVAVVAVAAPAVPAVPPGDVGAGLAGVLGGVRVLGIGAGAALLALGAAALRSRSAARRERGWELEAVGVAAAGIGWIAAVAGSGASQVVPG